MDKYHLNKRALSQKSEIPYTTIDAWYKKGYEGIKLTTLRKLNDFFNTSLDYWIMDEITDPCYGKTTDFKIDHTEMNHVEKYRALDSHGKEMVDLVLDRETARVAELQKQAARTAEPKQGHQPLPIRTISYYQRLTSAGTAGYLFHDIPTDTIKVPDTPTSQRADFVLVVGDDSMEPDYFRGEMVFVEKTADLKIGETGVFVRGNECFVKEVGEDTLISRNEKYPNVKKSNDIVAVGKVIGKLE